MSKFFTKDILLKCYKELSRLTDNPSQQGQTQITSAIKYCIALDNFKHLQHSDCDTKNKNHKHIFIKNVGNVVSINTTEYTSNFYLNFRNDEDYNVGSNFFSANTVATSSAAPDRRFEFPKRFDPLFEIQDRKLLVDSIRYRNLSSYLTNDNLKSAIAIWLLREYPFSNAVTLDNVERACRGALSHTYTDDLITVLLSGNLSGYLCSADNVFGSYKANISKKDIIKCFQTTITTPHNSYSDDDFLKEVYMSEQKLKDMQSLLLRKKNLILMGAPGTGKTFTAKRLAWTLTKSRSMDNIDFVQFHQNTSYEDFIEGFRPQVDGTFIPSLGKFATFCKRAEADRENNYFFIIDEINRANTSKVFGETLMAIENSHRDECVTLAVTGHRFCVPSNVYIIGTMNTADRSIALIDYALRRRFAFFKMEPALDNKLFNSEINQTGCYEMIDLISTVKELNQSIENDDVLGKGYQIGHSYFCPTKEATVEKVYQIVEYELIPLLEEYWFDDDSKVEEQTKKLRKTYEG